MLVVFINVEDILSSVGDSHNMVIIMSVVKYCIALTRIGHIASSWF